MKLLIAELDRSRQYVSREFFFIMQTLLENPDWKHLEVDALDQDARPLYVKILDTCGAMPDVILFWSTYRLLNTYEQEIRRLPCQKCFFADDLHHFDDNTQPVQRKSYAMCDVILATYAYNFHHFYPDLASDRKIVWVPHAASDDFLLPFNSKAENTIFLSGYINQFYPLRQKMRLFYEDRKYPIVYHRHPGYHRQYDYGTNPNVGRDYAKIMQRYKIGFTDSLIYRYTVAKYFEIPATGALLLADGAVRNPLQQLGFIANERYIAVSSETLDQKIMYVLNPRYDGEIEMMRKRAQQLVWEHHTVRDRARLINDACGGEEGSR